MRKIIFTVIFTVISLGIKAQYKSIDAILTRLEERTGINQNLENVDIDHKKFVLIKDFEDHTERKFIVLQGKKATYIEIFDDKNTGKSSSNVFTGDFIKSRRNIISIRADQLEGKKIAIPITKTLLLTKQQNILYLYDVNNKDHWIDEVSLTSKK